MKLIATLDETERLDALAAVCFPAVFAHFTASVGSVQQVQVDEPTDAPYIVRERIIEETVRCAVDLRDALDRRIGGRY